jgi:hypothetical protein
VWGIKGNVFSFHGRSPSPALQRGNHESLAVHRQPGAVILHLMQIVSPWTL